VSGTPASILITGATGKMGRTFALGFAAKGVRVAFTARSEAAAQALAAECAAAGAARVAYVLADLTEPEAPQRIAHQLAQQDMLPEVLVNNARNVAFLKSEPNGLMGRANWQGELLLDVVVPYELTMALLEIDASALKRVVNIASMYGVTAPNMGLYANGAAGSPINYGVAKAALIHLTKDLAVRLAPRNVQVNAISYGGVEGRVDPAFLERYSKLCPMGRMLGDAEVFGALEFLASSAASGMTGHNLVVDGGWTVW
jgi:NAD(P)-dependent dehydrogenase (short-subunit alcohol dehydrogenase family)